MYHCVADRSSDKKALEFLSCMGLNRDLVVGVLESAATVPTVELSHGLCLTESQARKIENSTKCAVATIVQVPCDNVDVTKYEPAHLDCPNTSASLLDTDVREDFLAGLLKTNGDAGSGAAGSSAGGSVDGTTTSPNGMIITHRITVPENVTAGSVAAAAKSTQTPRVVQQAIQYELMSRPDDARALGNTTPTSVQLPATNASEPQIVHIDASQLVASLRAINSTAGLPSTPGALPPQMDSTGSIRDLPVDPALADATALLVVTALNESVPDIETRQVVLACAEARLGDADRTGSSQRTVKLAKAVYDCIQEESMDVGAGDRFIKTLDRSVVLASGGLAGLDTAKAAAGEAASTNETVTAAQELTSTAAKQVAGASASS